jgi:hypothetical protein
MLVRERRSDAWATAAREIALLAVLFAGYKLTRHEVGGRIDIAFANARRVIHLEDLFHVGFEAPLQRFFLHSRSVVVALNRYYVSMHFSTMLVFLVWLFVTHRDAYARIRRILVMTTGVALVAHIAFPLAPPRMMPGFVDTMAVFGPDAYGSARIASLANQYAAMPSVHFAWSLIVAYGVIHAARPRLRRVAVIHPALTLLAILVTANHYWLDAGVAGAVLAVAFVVDARLQGTLAPADAAVEFA